MPKPTGLFLVTNQDKSAHRSLNGRKSRPGESARSAIWRRGVPTNEKKDRLLRRERVITHTSRPEGPFTFLKTKQTCIAS